MPPRNPRPPAGPDFDRFASRLEAGQNALRERVEELFDGIDTRMSRIERDAAHGEKERRAMMSEFGEIRVLLGEARDLTGAAVTGQIKEAAKGAAEGAAAGAATTAAAVAVTTAHTVAHPPGAKTWRYWITGLAGVAAFGALADNLPKIVKLLSTIWKALEGLAK